MASYIKTLKEDNGDITYPQTLGSAVLLTGGADLETELAGKASAAAVAGKIDIGDVQTSDITAGAVTNAKIADSTISQSKIDWTTMRDTFTGTTDGNGFIAVPTGTVTPTTGFILGARRAIASDTGQTDGILLPYTDHSQSRYTLKFINWNMQANGNQTITVDIIYCLLS